MQPTQPKPMSIAAAALSITLSACGGGDGPTAALADLDKPQLVAQLAAPEAADPPAASQDAGLGEGGSDTLDLAMSLTSAEAEAAEIDTGVLADADQPGPVEPSAASVAAPAPIDHGQADGQVASSPVAEPAPVTSSGLMAVNYTVPAPEPIQIAQAPAPAPAPAAEPAPAPAPTTSQTTAAPTSSGTLLPGTGVRAGLVDGCNPVIGKDFIDSPTWQQRRLAPRDCELMIVNPPLFVWRQPEDKLDSLPWTFTLRAAGGQQVLSTRPASPAQMLAQPLAAGSYEWAVSYVRKSDRKVVSSQWRRFVVPESAQVFIVPNGQAIATRAIAKSAPRLLPAGATFAGIAAKARSGEMASAYKTLLKKADGYATRPVPPEPEANTYARGSSAWKKWKIEVRKVADEERTLIETLGMAWRLTEDSRYLEAGRRHFAAVAKWSPTGSISHESHDLANSVLVMALARGMDLFAGNAGNDTSRAAAVALRGRIAPILAEFGKLDTAPYDSHGIELAQIVTEALLLSAGHDGFPESAAWLASSWDLMVRTLAVWGDDHGSWGNGSNYAWRALSVASSLLATSSLVTGFDLGSQPWVRNFGDFLMAMTAPGSTAMASMGDGTEKTDHYAWHAPDAFRLFAALSRKPEHAWYLEAAANIAGPVDPLHFLLLGLPLQKVAPVAPAQPSALFHDAGVVAMHDNPAAKADRSTVFFRSSRFGSFNHSHADQNSFSYVSRGKNLLVSGGYYPWYLSNHHAAVGRATRYKNALTFDGGIGQAEPVPNPTAPGKPMMSMDARGELVNFAVSGNWTLTTGDATLAYRGWDARTRTWQPLLGNALRTVAYNRKERVIVVYDWATSETPRKWELNFNAMGAFTGQGNDVKVAYAGASACISVHGLAGSYRLTSGFDVEPESPRPQQYQARFVASARSPELAAVTVIRDDCRSVPVDVRIDGTKAAVTIGTAPGLSFDRRTARIGSSQN